MSPGEDVIALVALGWLVFINIVTYATFARDKEAAERGDWRVPERTLLLMAAAGGALGAIAAQQRLHHKTQKQPFAAILFLIAAAQAVFLIALADPDFRARIVQSVLDSVR
ncbi:MAG TPA: DUF1294 domain-containing protein [Bauldia sp.]|nr:DUF1294 domain-containing protein [Bauldia sp.]